MSEPTKTIKRAMYCSFCGKGESEGVALIAGPTVFICSECAALCVEIFAEGGGKLPPERNPQDDLWKAN